MIPDRSAVSFGLTAPPTGAQDAVRLGLAPSTFGEKLRLWWQRRSLPSPPSRTIPVVEEIKQLFVSLPARTLTDMVLAEPALRALRQHFAHSQRTLIAPSEASDLFAGSGWGAFNTFSGWSSIEEEEHAEDALAVDLNPSFVTACNELFLAKGVRQQLGVDMGAKRYFQTLSIPTAGSNKQLLEHYLSLVRSIGAETSDPLPRLPRGRDRMERGRRAWGNLSKRRPVVLVLTGGASAAKTNRLCWLALGALRKEEQDAAMLPPPAEVANGAAWIQSLKSGDLFAKPRNLTDWMDHIAASGLVLTTDTDTAHIAAALGTPILALLPREDLLFTWPATDTKNAIYEADAVTESPDINEIVAGALYILES